MQNDCNAASEQDFHVRHVKHHPVSLFLQPGQQFRLLFFQAILLAEPPELKAHTRN
jgi:hypothetical protein